MMSMCIKYDPTAVTWEKVYGNLISIYKDPFEINVSSKLWFEDG